MKTNKLALQYGPTTVLNHVILELVKSKVDEIIVVTSREEKIEGVKTVVNPHPEKGMTSSIQTGVEAASFTPGKASPSGMAMRTASSGAPSRTGGVGDLEQAARVRARAAVTKRMLFPPILRGGIAPP